LETVNLENNQKDKEHILIFSAMISTSRGL